MINMQAIKSLVGTVASTGIWAPIVASLPEHLPLVAISGLCGGITRWIALKETFWPTGLGTIVVGLTVAVFMWPVGQPLIEPVLGRLEMEATTSVMFGGFVTGLLGVSLLGIVLDIGKRKPQEGDDDKSSS